MSVKISEWDPSEYLDNDESIKAYLNAAFEDGDPKLIASAIGDVARAQGMTEIARQTGLAREALYRALSEKGNPELATVINVLKSLNMAVRVEPIEPRITETVTLEPMPSRLYSHVTAAELNSTSIVANSSVTVLLPKPSQTGEFNERKGSIFRLTGEIRRARIRNKIPRSSSASTSSSLKYAGGSTSNA